MDKKKGLLNVSVSVGFKIITMVMAIVVKRMLILSCGNEVNGLNALYISIIGFLSVAELGIGTAITFCMYKPIVDGDTGKVAALYHLFRKVYTTVGVVVLLGGLLLTPFIHYFAKDYAQIQENLYLTFFLVLVSTVLTYFFGADTALINAYKNNYITTSISSGGIVVQNVLQIVVLGYTGSFVRYLLCKIIAVFLQWCVTGIITHRKHGAVLKCRQQVDADTKKELLKNIKAMFTHKIGGLLVHTCDSVIISVFVGVVALGEYSNYTAIMSSMTGIIGLLFSSLTSVWGHLYAKEGKAVSRWYFELFHYINFAVGMIFYLGYYAVIDNLVAILYPEDLVVSGRLSAVITVNGFVQFLRQTPLTFRDVTGTFYYDRWKPLFEGIMNIVLSILFVNFMGVPGVLTATIMTNLVICHIVEPYVLYKYAFDTSVKRFYLRNYGMIFLFVVVLVLFSGIMWDSDRQGVQLLVNGALSVCVSAAVCVLALIWQPEVRRNLKKIVRRR